MLSRFKFIQIGLFALQSLVFFALCFFVNPPLQAKQQFSKDSTIHFSNLNSVEHLSHLGVLALAQDQQGFIWFGTIQGLFRYDGHVAKRFLHEPTDPNSLSDSYIQNLLNDSEGRLWVVTDTGLDLYLPESQSFRRISVESDQNWEALAGSADQNFELKFDAIQESANGEIWLSTQYHGVAKYDLEQSKFVFFDVSDNHSFRDRTSDIEFSSDNTLWVGKRVTGLSYREPGSNQFFNIELMPGNDVAINKLFAASNDMLFVGTEYNGLFVVDTQSKSVSAWFNPNGNTEDAICASNVMDFIEDTRGNVWTATSRGLCKLNNISHSFSRFSKDSENSSTLVHDVVRDLMQDQGGVIWVGTESGVSYWNASLSYFEQVTKISKYGELSSSSIMSFSADKNLNVYIGGQNAGLDKFNEKDKTIEKIDLSHPRFGDFNDGSVMSQLVDGQFLYIGTFSSGLLKYDLENESLVDHVSPETNPVMQIEAVSKIIKLKDGQLAIGTYGAGLYLLDSKTNEIKSIFRSTEQQAVSSAKLIVDMKEDNQGYIWLATKDGGLNYVTPDHKNVIQVVNKADATPLVNQDIFGISVDNEMLWLATHDSGVCRIARVDAFANRNNFKCITSSDGLASSFPYNIIDSDDGYLWLSHNNGLSRINKNSLKINNFDTTHGLIEGDFHSSAYFKDGSGRLYFGNSNGFNTFMPNNVPINNYRPPLRLTKFSHANIEKPIQTLLRSDGVLELDYKETIVDFEFAALDYTKPSNNRYQYRLEGQNNDWVDLGTNNHVFFSYLPDGDYTLRVRGSNNEGVWSEEITIAIEVLPPIWASWYAYFAYFLAAILVVLSIMRQQQIKHQRQLSHERRLHQLAYFDSLTGLPNRQSFYENLEKFISLAKRGNYRAGVMFIDLDRFKRINDTLGHDYGDQVLQEVAHRLKESVRESDIVARNYEVKSFNNEIARLGGDEFTLFLSHIESPEETTAVTQRIIDSLSQPIKIDHYELTVTPSIGIAMYPDNGTTVNELMKHADIAMYQAKEGGRRTFKFYSNSLNDRALERLQLEEQMRNAVKEQQFTLFYQPQVDLQSNEVTKAEALVRWIHPELGFVSPGDFIPIAEESGLIIELGDWILNTACIEAKRWLDSGLENCRVSVNVSSVQFKQTALVDKVKNALINSGLPPHLLELEVTESAVMSDVDDNIERLQQLKNMGITVAVDDFGTGYSSLSYLKRFPIDTLKIDRSFVDDIATDENDEAIVRAIMVLAETMGLKVVAEGIETLEQLRILHDFGCQHIQGFFFSKPLPYEEFVHYVKLDYFAEKAMWKLDLLGQKQPA